jgi:hypothetical protein
MLSFQSTLSRVFDCMILQFSFSISSLIILVVFSYISNKENLAFGKWFSHTRLFKCFAKKSRAFLSSSKGLNKTLTSFKVPLQSSSIAKLSWLVRALWLRSRC